MEIKEKVEMINRGEIPKGYKKTKVGIIPEDWEVRTLSDINVISTGVTPLRSNHKYFDGDIYWVKTTDLNNYYIIDTEEKITQLALKETSLKYVEKNSILIAMYGGFNQIGRTGLMKIRGTTNQAISSFLVDEVNYNSEYVLHWLNSNRKRWERFAASSRKDPNITKKDVEDFPIIKLKYLEQQKIAQILSTWDKSIELKEKLIEQKKQQKKGLMQNLLTGKVRLSGFDGEWEEVKLGEVIKEYNERSTRVNQYEVLSVTKNGIVLQSEYFNKQIASTNNKGYKILKKGDLVFSSMNLWMGSVDILTEYEIGIVSPAYKVFKIDCSKIDMSFFKDYIKSSKMIYLYNINSEQGASVVRRNLDLMGLLNSKVSIPLIVEQKAIAQILSTADKEIDLLTQELEQLKLQKKGLMQLLLTGIVRVVTDN